MVCPSRSSSAAAPRPFAGRPPASSSSSRSDLAFARRRRSFFFVQISRRGWADGWAFCPSSRRPPVRHPTGEDQVNLHWWFGMRETTTSSLESSMLQGISVCDGAEARKYWRCFVVPASCSMEYRAADTIPTSVSFTQDKKVMGVSEFRKKLRQEKMS
ncbi:uncharacterized protein LOC133928322 isoform X2 [Phragmites australis]|uniref:uncharacterized protein LOC133928322 isoform X2 n=1 Tax=Phragmites australis TaxID=29695 RepID=UPI002D76D72A|nr:uncharacterized protein LOC133928322 isoform X2 [Phragmites australis]